MKNKSLYLLAGLAVLLPFEARAYTCTGGVVAASKWCCPEKIQEAARVCGGKDILCNACTGKFKNKKLDELMKRLSQNGDPADGESPGDSNLPSKARDCGKGCVAYTMPDGSTVKKKGGTLSWRENNPGNLEYGQFARDHGAIGRNGRWAVFPDQATGTQAMEDLVSKNYGNSSIKGMVYHYAPPTENNSSAYANYVANATGVPRTTRINNLSNDQFIRLVGAMRRIEGWKVGRTVSV